MTIDLTTARKGDRFEARAEQEDADLVRRRDQQLIQDLRNPMWVHEAYGEATLDHGTVVPDMALAATRIEALLARATKAEAALAEARKVIAPFKLLAEITDYKPPNASVIVNVNHVRAARDWLTKNGGLE